MLVRVSACTAHRRERDPGGGGEQRGNKPKGGDELCESWKTGSRQVWWLWQWKSELVTPVTTLNYNTPSLLSAFLAWRQKLCLVSHTCTGMHTLSFFSVFREVSDPYNLITLHIKYYYPCLINGDTEAQRDEMIFSQPHSQWEAQLGFESVPVLLTIPQLGTIGLSSELNSCLASWTTELSTGPHSHRSDTIKGPQCPSLRAPV